MTIELELELEAQLAERAHQAGKRPEDYAAEVLRASLRSVATKLDPVADISYTDAKGIMRNASGTALGFDGMTWRQLAHADHKH